MNRSELERLTAQLLSGNLAQEDFIEQLAQPRSAALGETTLDLDRQRRCGFPEVVFGEGKTVAALEKIFRRLLEEDMPVLATRVSDEKAAALTEMFPQGVYHLTARTFRIAPHGSQADLSRIGRVIVVTAGTSDLPVAEEARETLDWMGVATEMLHDIGVAGPHRLLEKLHVFEDADAAVVAAGMEGALPSVVGGHVACPVIAVPTSVGYGASFGGVAALLGMLNSCAANVVVVNIDAGFKAGYVAGLIAHQRHPTPAGA
ncbi:MAG: nickel pincer cofactor biosynthesis protein LarB [Planctomycetes bacterium]|nr:nickel pincer cofactor biosynthesis protein LarB [Planctomycetota bacterium]